MGGMYTVVEALVRVAQKNGVQFIYDSPVQRIDVDGACATGVTLESGDRLSADVVIANADLPYVYRHLLPDARAANQLERKKYTCSAVMFYWGVDRQYPQLGAHNVFLAGDYRASFDRIFNNYTLPEAPSFYVHAPARIDPSLAPPGQDTLMVLVPVGHLDEAARQDWPALQARARAIVLARLSQHGVKDLAHRVKFEVSYTPHDWRSLYNLAKGSAFGLSHNFSQVGYLRPRNRHDRYRNLYFVGASTHPGTGLPMVLLSARLTTQRVVRDAASARRAPRLAPATAR
jgi:phytoene desaturase